MTRIAHVSNEKKAELASLGKLVRNYKVIGVLDLGSYPSSHLQKLKSRFRDNLEVKVSKKSIIKLAFENAEKERAGIMELNGKLDEGIPGLIFSNEDPFKLSKKLIKDKSNTFAKAGQIAPHDIIIAAGPTSFAPGPVIGELSSAGLKTAVESGKITIKEDKLFVKKGEIIDQKKADVLSKLGIEPMEIGVRIIAMYENGSVYGSNLLAIDEETYVNELRNAVRDTFNIAINISYATKDTIKWLVKKAYIESLVLSNKTGNDDGG